MSIAGFIPIDVASREGAIAWAMRLPDPQGYGEGQIELRQNRIYTSYGEPYHKYLRFVKLCYSFILNELKHLGVEKVYVFS